MSLKVWLVFATLAGSSSGFDDPVCQFQLDCVRPLPPHVVQCLAPFDERFMAPLTRLKSPVNEGRRQPGHLFDLFLNGTADDDDDDEGCSSLGVCGGGTAEGGGFSVNLVVGCRSTVAQVSMALRYETRNGTVDGVCGLGGSGRLAVTMMEGGVETRFYRGELLRLTVISEDVVLIEDLSPVVPPGTRMFFRIRVRRIVPGNQVKCLCKNYNRLVLRYGRGTRTRRKIEKRRNTSETELWIALVLVVLQWISMIVGRLWVWRAASRKHPSLKKA